MYEGWPHVLVVVVAAVATFAFRSVAAVVVVVAAFRIFVVAQVPCNFDYLHIRYAMNVLHSMSIVDSLGSLGDPAAVGQIVSYPWMGSAVRHWCEIFLLEDHLLLLEVDCHTFGGFGSSYMCRKNDLVSTCRCGEEALV